MYAIIAKYKSNQIKIVFKSFNRDMAQTFYNNAKTGMAGIWYEQYLIELKFATIEAKSNATLSPITNSNLFHQSDGITLVDGHRIKEIIEIHNITPC